MKLFFAALFFCVVSLCAAQQKKISTEAVMKTVHDFTRALTAGDSATVDHLLAPDAVILESGNLETRKEYLAYHMKSDFDFMKAVTITQIEQYVTKKGNAAWVSSTSSVKGEFNGRPIALQNAELIVLTRSKGKWKISAIHWSSRKEK